MPLTEVRRCGKSTPTRQRTRPNGSKRTPRLSAGWFVRTRRAVGIGRRPAAPWTFDRGGSIWTMRIDLDGHADPTCRSHMQQDVEVADAAVPSDRRAIYSSSASLRPELTDSRWLAPLSSPHTWYTRSGLPGRQFYGQHAWPFGPCPRALGRLVIREDIARGRAGSGRVPTRGDATVSQAAGIVHTSRFSEGGRGYRTRDDHSDERRSDLIDCTSRMARGLRLHRLRLVIVM